MGKKIGACKILHIMIGENPQNRWMQELKLNYSFFLTDGCSNEAIVCLCNIVVCMVMYRVFYNNSHSFCLSTFKLDILFTLTLFTVSCHSLSILGPSTSVGGLTSLSSQNEISLDSFTSFQLQIFLFPKWQPCNIFPSPLLFLLCY